MKGSIQKKGNVRYVVFRVPDPETGKKKQKWIPAGSNKKEADKKLTEIMGEVHDGTYKDLKEATFKEFSEIWLSQMVIKASTLRGYKSSVNSRLVPVFGAYSLTDISTSMLKKYVADRINGDLVFFKDPEDPKKEKWLYRVDPENKEPVKPKTVLNEMVPLNLIFEAAVVEGYLKKNPAENLKLKQVRKRQRDEKEDMEILTPGEVNLFLSQFDIKISQIEGKIREEQKKENPSSDRIEALSVKIATIKAAKVFFLTAVLTGMRPGEGFGLQWKNFDWNKKQVNIRQSFCNTSKKFIPPKTKSAKRSIDLTPHLVEELKEHRRSSVPNDLDLVFSNRDGKPLDERNMVQRYFEPALKMAGIRHIRLYDLRHTNVSLRLEQGQNIFYISKQIGHARPSITLDVYSHLMKDEYPEQAQKLDMILGFGEQCGNLSESVRRMLEESPAIKEKGAADNLQPLELVGSGGRI